VPYLGNGPQRVKASCARRILSDNGREVAELPDFLASPRGVAPGMAPSVGPDKAVRETLLATFEPAEL
jgi:hypothetical protein